ncbi:major facilitator superfamily protein [Mucor ambiguus]|uniref:Major facilitator superfamily protein n=1 Tax=Mucor ambiguus TaxID=91626 RepID=A0A0C9LVQ7_9FUNG|nr:major facilitator superfamily protein [Mucor ambiguus]
MSDQNHNVKIDSEKELSVSYSHEDQVDALENIDPKLEARIRRKLDMRVVPMATLIYLMAFIDRSNMGNAKNLGMTEDLGLTGHKFSITLTTFFITYVLFEIPTNIMCKKFGPRIWLSMIVFAFGIVSMCLAFSSSFAGLATARAFLGIAEAGIMPGISYMLSTFYRRHELVTRVGIYASFASLAGAFGGLLAIGFSRIPEWGIMHTWRNIFFFEGILTFAAGIVCYLVLPDSPETASFLTEEERRIASLRIRLETLTHEQKKLKRVHFVLGIKNINIVLMSAGLFCSLLCMNSIALFMPSLLATMGFDSIKSQLMTVPPYACGTIFCIIAAMTSDRLKTRGPILIFAAGPLIVIAFIILLTVETTGVRYMAIFFATCGAFTGSPVFVAWLVDNSSGPMVRAIASAFAVSVGSLGGLVATWTYLAEEAPEYKAGHIINLCAGCVIMISATLATINCRWENKQRAEGKRDYRLDGLTDEQMSELGHTHPNFRYTT